MNHLEIHSRSPRLTGIFDLSYISSIYPMIDLSHNLYYDVCVYLESNKRQLYIFEDLDFRDRETKILLVEGTKDLIRRLNNLKRFLEKYDHLVLH